MDMIVTVLVLMTFLIHTVHGQCPLTLETQAFCECDYQNVNGHQVPRYINCTGISTNVALPFNVTPDIFQDFVIVNSTIPKLQSYMFNNIKTRNLQLSDIGIREIDVNAFLGSESYAETLDISHNQISSLPSRLFSYSGLLTVLDVSSNQLSSISAEAFIGLSKLAYLDLGRNQLQQLPGQVFSNLPKLETLLLDGNQITALYSDSFSGLAQLQVLHLSSNRISSISEDAFSQLSSLQQLLLSFNNITSLPENMLQNNLNLEQLTLSENSLSRIPENLLFPTKNLHFADFSYNNIQHLDNFPFKKLEMLQKLYLQHNKIRTLYTNVFEDLNGVRELNLAHNEINNLFTNCLVGLTQAFTVHLDNNQISKIPYGLFDSIGNVMKLNLSHNVIMDFEDTEPFLANGMLADLDMSWNDLTAIPPSLFKKTLALRSLSLSNNRIKRLYSDSFSQLKNLIELDLSHNRINMPPGLMFVNCSQLERLEMSWNPLHTLPDTLLTGLGMLRELYLASGCLDGLPDQLCTPPNDHLNITNLTRPFLEPYTTLSKLQTLHLQGNFLESLSLEPLKGASLRELHIQQNNISSIDPQIFAHMTNMTFVNISRNALNADFHSALGNMGHIKVLDLSYNQFLSIERNRLELDDHFEKLYLGGNPIRCECEAAFLRDYTPLQDYGSLRCGPGNTMRNQLVVCFPELQLGCPKWPPFLYYDAVCNYTNADLLRWSLQETDDNYQYTVARMTFEDFCVVIEDITTVSPIDTEESTNRTSKFIPPHIVDISSDPDTNLIRVQWQHKDTSLVAGYTIRYRRFATNETYKSDLIDNRFWYVINNTDIRENYIICVDVVLLDGELVSDEEQCREVQEYKSTTTPDTSTAQADVISNKPQLLLPVVLAAAIVVAIILLVIIGVRISMRRRRYKERQQKAMSPDQKMNMWDFSYRGNVNEEMVEHATLPYDMFSGTVIVDPRIDAGKTLSKATAKEAKAAKDLQKKLKKSKRVKRRKTGDNRKPSVLEGVDNVANRNSMEDIDNDIFTSADQNLPPHYEEETMNGSVRHSAPSEHISENNRYSNHD